MSFFLDKELEERVCVCTLMHAFIKYPYKQLKSNNSASEHQGKLRMAYC
jgi:hypothetical protein